MNIWFESSIIKILNYKSKKDTLRDLISKNNKKKYSTINKLYYNKIKFHPNSVFINENGLYELFKRTTKI
jgi:prophage antirepressor-like protein